MEHPGPDIDRGANVVAMYVAGCAVSFIFVLLRFWARYHIRGLAADDWVMLATWVPFVPLTVLTCQLVLNGGTRHAFYLAAESPENLTYLIKTNWIAQPFGIFCLGIGKVAIALLLVRLLDRAAHGRKWILYGVSIWTTVNTILMIVITFVQCRDPRALWRPELKAVTKCWNPSVQSDISIYGSSGFILKLWLFPRLDADFGTGAFSFVDFVLAFMPLTFIWHLKLDAKKKIGLAILLGCGTLTGICAAVKTSKLVSLASRSDLTWETYDLYMWTGIEIVLLIICGSIPTLKPLYELAFGKSSKTPNPSYQLSSNSSKRISVVQTYKAECSSSRSALPKAMEPTRSCSEEHILRSEP